MKLLLETPFKQRTWSLYIFFYLEKTYDTTWKYGILRDLHNIGLKGHLSNFIQNFLSNRHFNVHVYPKRKSHDYPCLHLDGNKIKVKEVKFLAIIFDSKLSFVPHIEMLKEKCTKALDGVKMVAHSK